MCSRTWQFLWRRHKFLLSFCVKMFSQNIGKLFKWDPFKWVFDCSTCRKTIRNNLQMRFPYSLPIKCETTSKWIISEAKRHLRKLKPNCLFCVLGSFYLLKIDCCRQSLLRPIRFKVCFHIKYHWIMLTVFWVDLIVAVNINSHS